MLGHKRLEPTDQLQVTARLEVSLDRKLERREAELLQSPRLGRGERLVQQVRERRSAPEVERYFPRLLYAGLLHGPGRT